MRVSRNVQGEPETAFAERMFVYNHKIRDAHSVPVASLAVLADTDPRFRPEHYSDDLWGCSVDFRFPMVKLIDWDTPEAWPALEASNNPFALVVMAQIRAKATKDAETREKRGRKKGDGFIFAHDFGSPVLGLR